MLIGEVEYKCADDLRQLFRRAGFLEFLDLQLSFLHALLEERGIVNLLLLTMHE